MLEILLMADGGADAFMRDFRELKFWQKSHELILAIYKETERFPKNEIYGLTSQIRRAAVSIGANIAERAGKNSRSVPPNQFGISKRAGIRTATCVRSRVFESGETG